MRLGSQLGIGPGPCSREAPSLVGVTDTDGMINPMMEVTPAIPEKGPSNQTRLSGKASWRRWYWHWALKDEYFSEGTTSEGVTKLQGEQNLGKFREFLTRA